MDDDLTILGRDDDPKVFKQFLAQYDAPAYVRRARQVEDAFQGLVAHCRQKRDEWLQMVRIHLGRLHGLAGAWDRLVPLLADAGQAEVLRSLHAELKPAPRLPVEPTSSARALRRATLDLITSIEYFNRRWLAFLPTVERGPINELRDGYNRYYLLEKECAVRSARVARQGFRRLEPLTTEELTALLPPLPVPRLAKSLRR